MKIKPLLCILTFGIAFNSVAQMPRVASDGIVAYPTNFWSANAQSYLAELQNLGVVTNLTATIVTNIANAAALAVTNGFTSITTSNASAFVYTNALPGLTNAWTTAAAAAALAATNGVAATNDSRALRFTNQNNAFTASSLNIGGNPTFTQSTNIIAVYGAGSGPVNGTYVWNSDLGVYTNNFLTGAGFTINFQNPTWFITSFPVGVNLYSASSPLGPWTKVFGFNPVPTSAYGFYQNQAGNVIQGIINSTNLDARFEIGVSNATSLGGLPAAYYVTDTNFFTRNVRFVDAGNGSDLNDGTVNRPWATIQHAQTNTPVGWTLAIAPGSYVENVTNFTMNYYLSFGANVTFQFDSSGTNAISGDGDIKIISGEGNPTVVTTIHCNSVQVGVGALEFFPLPGINITINADQVSGKFWGEGTTNSIIIHCRKFVGDCVVDSEGFGGSVYASESATLTNISFNSESVLKSPMVNLMSSTYAFPDGSGFILCAGRVTADNLDATNSIHFPDGMTFLNDPLFDHSVDATNSIGSFQTP